MDTIETNHMIMICLEAFSVRLSPDVIALINFIFLFFTGFFSLVNRYHLLDPGKMDYYYM